ncbi:MAG: SDR family oxidoreductase [Candidatus Zixiibacteriota bacterium]
MRYLVTGGAGFIGSNIVEKLLQLGHEVRVLDNFSTGQYENIASFEKDIDLIDGDIRDFATVTKAARAVDFVLHQAALPSVPRSVADPLTSNAVNVDGTLNILEASKRAGVKRFVFASSSSVYGESEELPKHEQMVPSPLSPYAVNKLTNEYYCKVYWQLYKLPTVSLRYFNVFGPRQDPKSEYAAVVPRFITALQNGQPPVVYGDGGQSRDFTYVENAVNANLLAAQTDAMSGGVFNCACGAQYTLNQLLERLRAIMGIDIQAMYDKPRPGDIRHSFAAIDRLKKHGFEVAVDFDQGLRRTVAFFAGQPASRAR